MCPLATKDTVLRVVQLVVRLISGDLYRPPSLTIEPQRVRMGQDASDFVLYVQSGVWTLHFGHQITNKTLGWRDAIDAERCEGVYTSTAV